VRNLILLYLILQTLSLSGQNQSGDVITAFGITYSEDYTDWSLYGQTEDPEGNLKIKWIYQNDWSEWVFRFDEITGQIKLRSKNDPNIWELRSGGKVITMKTIYPGDFNQWRITDDTYTITYKTKYTNVYDGWVMDSRDGGSFQVYTQWEMDPRDWIVDDSATDKISFTYKMAMIFLSSYYSSPKY
jgi:hypothetical protein